MKYIKIFMLLAAILLFAPVVFASADFEVVEAQTSKQTCPTHFVVYEFKVVNLGDVSDSYTITKSGMAANWALISPAGFILAPGESQDIYVYVSPSKDALSGEYSLDLKITSGKAGSKTIENVLNVKECNSVSLSSDATKINTCSGEQIEFNFDVINEGIWTETFELSMTGSAAKAAYLNTEKVRLDALESEEVSLQVDSSLLEPGRYYLTVTADSLESRATEKLDFSFQLEGCYNYRISALTYQSLCENSELKVPLRIENIGLSQDTYTLDIISGPKWAVFETEQITINGGEYKEINLVLTPKYGESGAETIKVLVESEKSQIKQLLDFKVDVQDCYGLRIDLGKDSDRICVGNKVSYPVSITNLGNFSENIALSVNTDWATLDQNFIQLEPAESRILNLEVEPDSEVLPADYKIKINAELQRDFKVKETKSLDILVPSIKDCFGLKTKAEISELDVAYGEGALIPIVVENLGTEKATYFLDLSGNGVSYANLNPAILSIEGNSAQIANLYISVPLDAEKEEYSVIVSARNSEGIVSSSSEIKFSVSEETSQQEESWSLTTEEFISGNKTSIFTHLSVFVQDAFAKFKSIFIRNPDVSEGKQSLVLENATNESAGIQIEEEAESVEQMTENYETQQQTEEYAGLLSFFKRYWHLMLILVLIVFLTGSIIKVALTKDDEFKNLVFEEEVKTKKKHHKVQKHLKKTEKKESSFGKQFLGFFKNKQKMKSLKAPKTLLNLKKSKKKKKKPIKKKASRKQKKRIATKLKGYWKKFKDWLNEE